MKLHLKRLTALLVLNGLFFSTSHVFAASCEDLMSLSFPNGSVTSAVEVRSGEINIRNFFGQTQTINNLPQFCRVEAVLTPNSDSAIRIEVWLPENDWNGKYLAVGNGAWAGSISTSAMAAPLRQGYVTSSTDTGHANDEDSFFGLSTEKLTDFAYRSIHAMAVQTKSIINAYYGRTPQLSYFSGCSTGGRQALTAVQRYPTDFNGVIAGAPAIYASHLQGAQLWTGTFEYRDGSVKIPEAKRGLIHDAVLQACDVIDGVTDGVLEVPGSCPFNPQTLACSAGTGNSCLTPQEISALSQVYQGPVNSQTGAQIFPGYELGSELGWGAVMGDQPLELAVELYQYLVFRDENWDYREFNIDQDVPAAEREIGELMDAIDPDLSAFVNNGGKLLLYHGWGDPGIPPANTVNYYQRVVSEMGLQTVSDSVRLFMVPGMGHCGGGEGPNNFDTLSTLDKWVQQDETPVSIIASRIRDGEVDRTRPLCAYPQVAVYDGSGSTNAAESFSCQVQ